MPETKRWSVLVQQAVDEAIYFTRDEPRWVRVWIEEDPGVADPTSVVLLEFVPSNGPHRNDLMQVPISRVISISHG